MVIRIFPFRKSYPLDPISPNKPRLYDPSTQRFVDAPASYQEITSPEPDAEYKQIVSHWRGGCCSHGIDVYRWKGKEVELIDSGSSYLQPVLSKGKMYTCYVIPSLSRWPHFFICRNVRMVI